MDESAIVWRVRCGYCNGENIVAMPVEPRFCIECGQPRIIACEAIAVDHDPAVWRRPTDTGETP